MITGATNYHQEKRPSYTYRYSLLCLFVPYFTFSITINNSTLFFFRSCLILSSSLSFLFMCVCIRWMKMERPEVLFSFSLHYINILPLLLSRIACMYDVRVNVIKEWATTEREKKHQPTHESIWCLNALIHTSAKLSMLLKAFFVRSLCLSSAAHCLCMLIIVSVCFIFVPSSFWLNKFNEIHFEHGLTIRGRERESQFRRSLRSHHD